MASVTIDAVSGGAYVALTVENVGDDQATMLIRTWAQGKKPPTSPKKSDQVKLYKVRRLAGTDTITCLADVWGADPNVRCELLPGNSDKDRKVRLVVNGSSFGLGDRDETHGLSEDEYQAMKDFFNAPTFR